MNNPLRILQTLDGYLTQPAEITLFGRAALALGFKDAPVLQKVKLTVLSFVENH